MDQFRFDKLHVKLFLAIAGSIGALTLAVYFVFMSSFERGFIQYLNRADGARLDAMIVRLAEGYARESGWSWIANDRERWIALSREALGLPKPQRERSAPAPTQAAVAPASSDTDARDDRAAAASTRDTPLTIDPRLMLFDANRRPLIGRPNAISSAILKPIVVGSSTVGYLGYVPRPEIIESIEKVYLERQRITFGLIALGMLVAALLLAGGLAYWLSRRIRTLARGTQSLIAGDYHVRLKAPGHDELAQLSRDFNTLAATLQATRTARQQWVADIAHELRTPLAVLRAEIESVQDGVRPLDQTTIDSLANETARLSRLVEDLHTLSMSDVGALTYHKEPTELAEIVADVVDSQRRLLEKKSLAVEMNIDARIRVLADETRLSQVFANLLQNNLRYTDAPGRIAVSGTADGDRVSVTWEDSGPGVPPEDMPRLTERLFRADASRNRASGGAGLGLAIAKAIVEGHGGTLTVRASNRGGLAVDVELPLHVSVE
jgi:two-component system sensor histidine kinase BaeS